MSDKYRPKILVFGVPNRVMYTNYKGETRPRNITPINFWYGHTEYHKDDQWFIKALDNEKNQVRDFTVNDMIPNFA